MSSRTKENYLAAFAGESQANRRYTAFAKAADEEGHPGIARLFRAAAQAETIHALNEFRKAHGVKSTIENLRDAITAERFESEHMYPDFAREADAEGQQGAGRFFRRVGVAEARHAELYEIALRELEKGQDVKDGIFYICPECGWLHYGRPSDNFVCPVCRTGGSFFYSVD